MKYLLTILALANTCFSAESQWINYWKRKPQWSDKALFIFKIDGKFHVYLGQSIDFTCYVRDGVDGEPIYWIELPEDF